MVGRASQKQDSVQGCEAGASEPGIVHGAGVQIKNQDRSWSYGHFRGSSGSLPRY